jgi:hypothetical protein
MADPADPAIATAEIASELRRGADYVRVTLALTVLSTDVADALTIAWDAFRSAARDDLAGWEVTVATAEVQPEPPFIRASRHTQRCSPSSVRGHAARARGTRSPSSFIRAARAIMSGRSWSVTAIASWASVLAMSSSARPYSPTSCGPSGSVSIRSTRAWVVVAMSATADASPSTRPAHTGRRRWLDEPGHADRRRGRGNSELRRIPSPCRAEEAKTITAARIVAAKPGPVATKSGRRDSCGWR